LAVSFAVLGCMPARSARAEAPEPFFMRQTGSFFHYVRESSTTFASIRSKIESGYYAARGARNFAIYCPYRATEGWRGVPAVDHFSTNPNTGSVDDFRAMVASAHARNMGVIAYMGLIFVDFENAIWVKAQQDRKAGRKSPEANTFRWASDGNGAVQTYGGWAYSAVAGSYYATSWNHPAVDLAQSDARAYVKSVLKFWMDLGVDGFEYDSIESFWGGTGAILKDVLVTYPNTYSAAPKYLIREGPLAAFDNAEENDALGLSHVLLSGDTDDRSVVTDVMDGNMSVDALEAHFQQFLDARRAVGRGAKAVSHYRNDSPAQRALDAAVLAGNGAFMEIDYDQNYSLLDSAHQQQYDAVFSALARSSAEAPGSLRRRVPAGPNSAYYAVLRTSQSGVRALNVYNFSPQSAAVDVDLAGTGIAVGQVPLNLATNKPAPAVGPGAYRVNLPPFGYAFLELGSAPAHSVSALGAADWGLPGLALLLGAIGFVSMTKRRKPPRPS
jgi:hypothetical protein